MSTPYSAEATRRDLQASTRDGAACSAMVGIGEAYLAAYVLALGKGEATAGLFTSVPLLCGALLQLAAPYAVDRLGSYRRWIATTAALQAAAFIPFVIGALAGSVPTPLLFAIAAVYWGAGQSSGAAWNAWMERRVPKRLRARYFSHRTRVTQVALLLGIAAGGGLLQLATETRRDLLAFAVLFACAALFRGVSAYYLGQQRDLTTREAPIAHVSLAHLLRRTGRGDDGRLFAYVMASTIAVHFAAPYFTPFMLRQLELSYGQFMVLVAAGTLAKVAALPYWARIVAQAGARRLLWIGGLGVVPLPALWLVSDFSWLVVAQLASGVAWSALELALTMLYFETIPNRERTSTLTLFNAASSAAQVLGASLGGVVLKTFGVTYGAYMLLFFMGTVARAGTILALRRVVGGTGQVPVPAPALAQARPLSTR